jgi:hypothetical protein
MRTEVSVSVAVGPAGSPLVIPDDCPPGEGGIQWTTLGEPEWALRYLWAPPSAYVGGAALLAAVPDSGEVPMEVVVRGTSIADLKARKTLLANALAAWPGEFEATATDLSAVDPEPPVAVAGPWETFPTLVKWGAVDVNLYGLYVAVGTFGLPVNPEGSP